MIELPTELRTQIESEWTLAKGWGEVERVIEIAKLILEEKPKRCLEVGVFAGRGLITSALALRHVGDGYIVGIDPWKNEPCLEGENDANKEWWSKIDFEEIYRELMRTIFRLGLENIALTLRARSQDAYWMFSDLDLLVIDGNHSEVVSCRDVDLFLPRVRSGGIISFDDTTWPSTQKALGMVDSKCEIIKSFENHIIYRKL